MFFWLSSLNLTKNKFEGLPFAKRWLQKVIPQLKLEIALRELIKNGAIYPYYILNSTSNDIIVQAEHTIVVADKPTINKPTQSKTNRNTSQNVKPLESESKKLQEDK